MSFATTGTTYKSYKKCYMAKLNKTAPAGWNTQLKNGVKEFRKGGWKFLSAFEKDLNCAGICVTPLFFLTKDIKAGPPTKDCMQGFVDKYGGNMALGAVAFITAIVLICAGICAIPLCTGYSKNEDEEE